jgi:hypothetical protein
VVGNIIEGGTKFELVVEGRKLEDVTKFESVELRKLVARGLEIVLAPVELLTDGDGMITLLSSPILSSSASCSMMNVTKFGFYKTLELCSWQKTCGRTQLSSSIFCWIFQQCRHSSNSFKIRCKVFFNFTHLHFTSLLRS